ncbi:hypothetical protein KUTeg_007106 [Tegillarca granosa]|uniref:Uncharacterized protein n=1 Tax=Tegillarca granosa TaxID=220873 RepID=A0ABQ9FE91_TEGGR|nr:hypothetical protein KUTeg_007106 [Tegillarca granosa]
MQNREGFRIIAKRGAVCFDTTQYMREVNDLYQISYQQFLTLFDTAIVHSESSAVMASLGYTQPADSRILQAKKPFDWMTDEQFHNLQVLANHFEWFQEVFERMPRDGREAQWRLLCDSEMPETVTLPDKLGDKKLFKPMQRLCVVRAVRSDRLMQASTSLFINQVLGKK